MIHCRNGILPEQNFVRNISADITGARPHVTVRQLEPRLGEGTLELFRMVAETQGNFAVDRICP